MSLRSDLAALHWDARVLVGLGVHLAADSLEAVERSVFSPAHSWLTESEKLAWRTIRNLRETADRLWEVPVVMPGAGPLPKEPFD